MVIGFALIAFILGDLFSSGQSIFASNQYEIAEIDGKSISVQAYQQKVENLAEIYKMNSGNATLDESTMQTIRQQTWQLMVQENVMKDQVKKLGLSVSPEEVFDMVQGTNVHPIIRQMFTNPQTGELNRGYILQFLKSLDEDPTGEQRAFWLYLEDEIMRERLMTKFNNLINKGLYATRLQAKDNYLANSKRVDFNYIMKRYSEVSDSLISVTDSDLKQYYRDHKEDFEQEASRDIKYVAFDIVPSKEDDRMAREWINEITGDFAATNEPGQFVNLNSDEPFDPTYLKEEELPGELKEFMANADTGAVYGPYFEDGSYKLAKLASIDYLPDSVKASHILLRPEAQTQPALEATMNLADSLKNLVEGGANFAALAREYSVDPSAADGGDLGWFGEGEMVPQFNDAVFNAESGDVMVVESQFGVHVIKVQQLGEKVKKYQLAILERSVEPSSATYNNIYSRASEFAGKYNTLEKFEEGASEMNITPRMANNLTENERNITGLESPREVIKWAYEAAEGETSGVFELGEKFVVAALVNVREDGYASLEDVEAQVRLEVLKEKKGEYLAEKIQEAMGDNNDLEEIAEALNVEVNEAPNISFNSFSIPKAGIEPSVVGTALTIQPETISEPVTGLNGVYLVKVTGVNEPAGKDNYFAERNRLNSTYNQRATYEGYEALKEMAGIEDKRSKFY